MLVMKSPVISVLLVMFVSRQHWLMCCYGEETLLWTQTSSVWSSIHGVHGDLRQYATTQNTIQSYSRVRSKSSKNANRIGLTYDPVQDLVCWSDDSLRAVYCQPRSDMLNLTSSSLRTLLSGIIDVRDIAVDWQTGNIYLANGRSIVVTPSRGHYQDIYKHLIWEGLRKVSGIAVDPNNNKLCWTDTERGRVECSTLLGAGRKQLIDQGHPVGITVVPDTTTIYWVDNLSKTVKGCSYECNNILTYTEITSQITPPRERSLYGIAVSSEMAFVTDTDELAVNVYTVDNRNQRFMRQSKKEIDAIPHQITVISPTSHQPNHDCISKKCQHMCLNDGNNKGICSCMTGFWLKTDSLTCEERDLRFIYTTGSQVVSYVVTINKTDPSTLLVKQTKLSDGGSDVKPLGWHFSNNMLYFGDINKRIMYSGYLTSSTNNFGEHTVNADVQGISVDWLSDNVYWTDKTLGRIMMSYISGRYHKLLISDAGKPTGLAVDSLNRVLFWNDNTDNSETIWKTDLMGSSRSSISTNIDLDDPLGLSIDPNTKRLYWVDTWKAAIYSIDYEGNDQKTILKSVYNERYYDTVIFQDIHSWTIQDKGIQFRSSLSGDKYEIHNYENTTRKGYDVIAFDGYLQPQEDRNKNPCQRNNGGCDQLCILMAGSRHSCQCAIGFQLNSDWKTCSSNISQEYFLLYTDPYHKQIYQTSLHDTSRTIQGVPGIRMHHPISVDYDRGKQRYFWYDNIRRQFRRSDGQSDELIREVETDSSPQRLVVDPVRGFVYYTDTGRSTISKMKVDGSGHEDLFTNVRRPFDIDLDFENEIIVWTTSNSVEKSDITKNDRIVIDKGLAQAGGVAILIGGQSVYYSDNVTGTIYSYNLTTKQRNVIYENITYRIQGLAVTDDYIYFTSYNDIGVYRINRTSGNSLTHLGDLVFARVTDIKVIRNKVEPKYREGFNWIILVAVLSALLLLLLLLAAIFGSRAARSKKKKEENPEVGATTGFDMEPTGGDVDVDQTYAYMNQSQLYDLRSSHDVMNGGRENGQSGLANGNGVTQRPDLINDGTFNNGGANNGQVNNGQAEPMAVASAAAPVVAGAATPRKTYTQEEIDAINQKYKPKKTWARRKKTIPRDPEFVFADDKVATRIQRLANRLRNRLSSVRWSSGDKQNDGETAQPTPEQGIDAETVDPVRSGELPKAQKIKGPPIRYQMPRGFAPASHCTPQHIKGT